MRDNKRYVVSRKTQSLIDQWYNLPLETRRIPWRIRFKRARRDKSLRHLFRATETFVVYPSGREYGVSITNYGGPKYHQEYPS